MIDLTILNTATSIHVTAPKGATFLQATDSKGRKGLVELKAANRGDNPFKDADIVELVAGTKGKQGQFIACDGAVTVSKNGEAVHGSNGAKPVQRDTKPWDKKTVAQKQAQRNGVKVAGKEYRSVKAAFEALGLPLNKHQAFRVQLKASGKATFEGHIFVLQ